MMRKVVYVCGACGRVAEKWEEFDDEACICNSQLCYEDSLKYGDNGRVIEAEPVKKHDDERVNFQSY